MTSGSQGSPLDTKPAALVPVPITPSSAKESTGEPAVTESGEMDATRVLNASAVGHAPCVSWCALRGRVSIPSLKSRTCAESPALGLLCLHYLLKA